MNEHLIALLPVVRPTMAVLRVLLAVPHRPYVRWSRVRCLRACRNICTHQVQGLHSAGRCFSKRMHIRLATFMCTCPASIATSSASALQHISMKMLDQHFNLGGRHALRVLSLRAGGAAEALIEQYNDQLREIRERGLAGTDAAEPLRELLRALRDQPRVTHDSVKVQPEH